jgi:hypothetical protein
MGYRSGEKWYLFAQFGQSRLAPVREQRKRLLACLAEPAFAILMKAGLFHLTDQAASLGTGDPVARSSLGEAKQLAREDE